MNEEACKIFFDRIIALKNLMDSKKSFFPEFTTHMRNCDGYQEDYGLCHTDKVHNVVGYVFNDDIKKKIFEFYNPEDVNKTYMKVAIRMELRRAHIHLFRAVEDAITDGVDPLTIFRYVITSPLLHMIIKKYCHVQFLYRIMRRVCLRSVSGLPRGRARSNQFYTYHMYLMDAVDAIEDNL